MLIAPKTMYMYAILHIPSLYLKVPVQPLKCHYKLRVYKKY